jgi:hypothetical protein
MDGSTLVIRLRNLLQERSDSDFLDDRTTYDYIYQAVTEFAKETGAVTGSQSITTVALQSAYDLYPEFIAPYLLDDDNNYFIKFYNGTDYTFVPYRDYDAIVYSNNTDSVDIPNNFTIRDKRTSETNLTGLATSTGTRTNAETALNDAAAPFGSVRVGDYCHNITDASDGIVIAVTSSASINCTLFGGTDDTFTVGDSYVIVPQPRKQLILDPPSKTSGYTATIEFIKRPDPVYSSYRSYPINPAHMPAILMYAAWLYKYRDREPAFGDAWFKHWDMQLRKMGTIEKKVANRYKWRVNLVKGSTRSRSNR